MDIPRWFFVLGFLLLMAGTGSMIFTVHRCGASGLILGAGGPVAAMTVCDGD
jgi:hypothetical protein